MIFVGGQIKGGKYWLFMIYFEGNFIEVSEDMLFFQIGEIKYGCLIFVCVYDLEMFFDEVIKLLLVFFDLIIKVNFSVDLFLDVCVYVMDVFQCEYVFCIEVNDFYYFEIFEGWGGVLCEVFGWLLDFDFDGF